MHYFQRHISEPNPCQGSLALCWLWAGGLDCQRAHRTACVIFHRWPPLVVFFRNMQFSSLVSLFATLAVSAVSAQVPWSYDGFTGPAYWSTLSPSYAACAVPKAQPAAGQPLPPQQSPINIQSQILPKRTVNYPKYYLGNLTNVPVTWRQSSITLNLTQLDHVCVEWNGVRYGIQDIFLHTPSEHRIDSKYGDLAIHIVGKSPQNHLLITSVIMQDSPDEHLTLSEASRAFISPIVASLPSMANQTATIPSINLQSTVDLLNQTGYFTYNGSITAPPCSPATWVIMANMQTVCTTERIKLLNRLGVNARPVQPWIVPAPATGYHT